MICDGKEVVHVTEDYAMDGHNMSSHSISKDSMGSHEQYETILNGVNTWFDVNDRYYYQSEYETDSSSLGGNLLGVDQDDEMARRMVNFMEIAADTVVLAMGTHSQEAMEASYRAAGLNAILVGSAEMPGRIAGATRDGFEKAWGFEAE